MKGMLLFIYCALFILWVHAENRKIP